MNFPSWSAVQEALNLTVSYEQQDQAVWNLSPDELRKAFLFLWKDPIENFVRSYELDYTRYENFLYKHGTYYSAITSLRLWLLHKSGSDTIPSDTLSSILSSLVAYNDLQMIKAVVADNAPLSSLDLQQHLQGTMVQAIVIIYSQNYEQILTSLLQVPWVHSIFVIVCTEKDDRVYHPAFYRANFCYLPSLSSKKDAGWVVFTIVVSFIHYQLAQDYSPLFVTVTRRPNNEMVNTLARYQRQILNINPYNRDVAITIHLYATDLVNAIQQIQSFAQAQDIVDSINLVPKHMIWREIYFYCPNIKSLYPQLDSITSLLRTLTDDEFRALYYSFWTDTQAQFCRTYNCSQGFFTSFINVHRNDGVARRAIARFLIDKVLI